MCKLCNTDRPIWVDYNGRERVSIEAMKVINDYIGENCCRVCLYSVTRNKFGIDHYIIKKLYRISATPDQKRVYDKWIERISNREKRRAVQAEYYSRNKEKSRISSKIYREKNRDKINSQQAKLRYKRKLLKETA